MVSKTAPGAKKEYDISSNLRLEAEARVPLSIKKLFTHKYSHTDSHIGVIEEHSLVMTRMAKPNCWEVTRIGHTHRLDGSSNIEPEDQTILSGVDCIDALRYLSGFERAQQAKGAAPTYVNINHYESAAKEAGIIFDLEGNPHPLVDGCIVTEGAFPVNKLREEGILISENADVETLSDVMGDEKDVVRYDYIMTRKQLLGNLQILLPLLTAMRDRFDEAIKGDYSAGSKDAFQRAATSCRDSVDKRMLGFPSDRQTLMNYITSMEVLVDLMETKKMFLALDEASGQKLIDMTEAVRRRVEKQQGDMENLGYTRTQQNKVLAYIVSENKADYPHSVNLMLQQFVDAVDSLKDSCRISQQLASLPSKKLTLS